VQCAGCGRICSGLHGAGYRELGWHTGRGEGRPRAMVELGGGGEFATGVCRNHPAPTAHTNAAHMRAYTHTHHAALRSRVLPVPQPGRGVDDSSEETYDATGPRQTAPEGLSGLGLDVSGADTVPLTYFSDDDEEEPRGVSRAVPSLPPSGRWVPGASHSMPPTPPPQLATSPLPPPPHTHNTHPLLLSGPL
jgi:hypothetical protein